MLTGKDFADKYYIQPAGDRKDFIKDFDDNLREILAVCKPIDCKPCASDITPQEWLNFHALIDEMRDKLEAK